MDSIEDKKQHILEMLDSLGFNKLTRFSVETEGRLLKLNSDESQTKTILQVPLQEDYSFDMDLCICNIVVNIAKNYFKDDSQIKSIESQKEKIDLIIAVLKDLNFHVYDLDSSLTKESLANNVYKLICWYSVDINLEISSSEIALIPSGRSISPCKIYLSNQFSYTVLSDICSFIAIMAKRMKEDYDYLNNVNQWV
ncbi:MAG: hypothetical protein KC646_10520 [Candidatus Cloacimonetes bacterium]|nr:hypothetical protein [Candidatus Cloacimonadota bacterium]